MLAGRSGNCVAGALLLSLLAAGLVAAQEKENPLEGADFKSDLPQLKRRSRQQARQDVQTRPGFRLELVASEPLVRDPIAMAFDENSNLFVVEFPEYNHKHAGWKITRRGTVKRLVDSDGDGIFDRSTVYVDQLNSPTAVACYNGGVLIAAAPDLLFCKDTDGDGRADVREKLYTGFGVTERGGGARLNSIRWSLDHQFHLCTSFSGGLVRSVGHPNMEAVDVQNRGFQFDPRSHQMAATTGAGQHGLAFDGWGNMFTCRNSNPFKQVMYESRYIARNPYLVAAEAEVDITAEGKHTKLLRRSPLEPWRILRTQLRVDGKYRGSAEGGTAGGFFTSATGIVVYQGDAWPEQYRGNLFVGEVSNNLVQRVRLEGEGLQKVARRASEKAEFLAASDNWFRPIELINGPDGNLYLADMHREVIETTLAMPPEIVKHLTPGHGVNHGRIYRVVRTERPSRKRPRIGSLDTVELVKLMDHRNGWHRETAARLLHERQDPAAVALLEKIAAGGKLAEGRLLALYALKSRQALTEKHLQDALADASAGVRRHGIRLAEPWVEDAPRLQARLLQLAADPVREVRYQLAFTLGQLEIPARLTALEAVLRQDPEDPWIRMAVLSSLQQDGGRMFQAMAAGETFRNTEGGAEFLESLARQVGAANQKGEVVGVLQAINQLEEKHKETAVKWVQALASKQKGSARKALLAAAGGKAGELLAGLVGDALRTVGNPQATVDQRSEAIRTLRLGEFAAVKTLAPAMLELQQPAPLQVAMIDTLASFQDESIAGMILEAWPGLSPTLRRRAVELLVSRPAWIRQFLDAIEQDVVGRGELDPARIELLKQHPDQQVASRVRIVFKLNTLGDRGTVVKKYQAALQLVGSQERGKALFKKTCSACHQLEGVGTAVGADLNGVRNQGQAALLLNILDPNRNVKPKFLTYVVQTDDGRVLSGLIRSESTNTITLRQPDGKEMTVQRVNIESMRSTRLSFMPEGMEKQLDHQGMADLLEYLVPGQ